jgi:hypothetical protein
MEGTEESSDLMNFHSINH